MNKAEEHFKIRTLSPTMMTYLREKWGSQKPHEILAHNTPIKIKKVRIKYADMKINTVDSRYIGMKKVRYIESSLYKKDL